MQPRPKPVPKPPKELSEEENNKDKWLKDVKALQKDLQSLSKLFLGFNVKGQHLVNNPTYGVTRELMNALDNKYKQSLLHNETI
ncbi:MAG: hypothetical protein ACKPKO_07620, partial [Candidatus Fonsibacter sp.]